MSAGPGPLVILLGAAAGALAALAAREAALASPAAARWLRLALEPLRRAEREGYVPTSLERRRLALLGAAAALLCGWLLAGARVALPLAVAGPALAAWAVSSRRRRYRVAVERALPEVAEAIADSLTAGRSLRASLPAAAVSLDGPAAIELARLGAELDLGAPMATAIAAWRQRMRSPRVEAFAAALLSQRLAGGDLAGLLRRFAEGAAERDRVAAEARTATAQARFTGLLVVALPSGAALLAELLQPGFLARLLSAPAAATLLALAAVLQLGGFLAIRRLVAPDALLEHPRRRRRRRLLAALPDALDLLAVGSASGRSAAAGFDEIGRASEGPLAEELRLTAAELCCGVPLSQALRSLRARVPGSEMATLCASIERSRRFGSPLAAQLRRQAGAVRRDQHRAVEERAARAAPKIQLVVALVLVPSVLLMIAAGLIANAGALLAGL